MFDASIAELQRLNTIGYGIDPALPLHLVFNPNGAKLPPVQAELEADYKRELRAHFGVEFNRLYKITNLPVSRFTSWLKHNGKFEEYMNLLVEAFNPVTVEGLMCRDTFNVSWLGEVFDCDFNQMMKLPMGGAGRPARYLWDIDPAALEYNSIATGDHCLGCTAGAGSSCGGAIETAVVDAEAGVMIPETDHESPGRCAVVPGAEPMRRVRCMALRA